jgi:arylsulfatase A-like enzyme
MKRISILPVLILCGTFALLGYLDNLIRQDSLGHQGKLDDRSLTMAEVLKASGYFTAMTSKEPGKTRIIAQAV